MVMGLLIRLLLIFIEAVLLGLFPLFVTVLTLRVCEGARRIFWPKRKYLTGGSEIATDKLIIGTVHPVHREVEFGWSMCYVRGGNAYRIVVQKPEI